MKQLFVCAAALALLAAVPAVAAPGGDHQGNKHDTATQGANSHATPGGTHQNAPGGAAAGGSHAGAGGGNPQGMMSGNHFSGGATTGGTHTRALSTNSHGATSGNAFSAGATTGGTHNRTGSTNTHNTTSGNSFTASTQLKSNSNGNGMHRTNSGLGNAAMSTNSTGRQPSINSLRHNVQASHHFHNGNYNAPQGYQSRQWRYGERLPRLYFARDYWITDYLMFGLFAPPTDLIWVRVGDDALLIDRYSGDIVQVDYGVFY